MSDTVVRPAEGYRRPAWNEAVSQALPARFQGENTPRWVKRAPLIILLVLLAALTLRLSNTAFIDEAFSINVGHDYLGYWLTGNGLGVYGGSYAGLPFVYPVLAAALDTLGGLPLVRAFSLLCIIAATVLVHRALAHLGYRAEGMLAAVAFALTGPVMAVGALATSDALVIAMLAGASWLGVRKGGASPVLAGVILGLVPVIKYSAVIFLPLVLVLLFLTSVRRQALVSGVFAVAIPAIAWLIWSDQISEAIALNTTNWATPTASTSGDLLALMTVDIGIILVIAVAGLVLLARRGPRPAVLGLLLLVGGLALPVAQLVLGAETSFDKHMAFSALFLAPLAGHALARLSRGTWKLLPTSLLILAMLLFGFSRSDAIHSSWVNISPVVNVIEENPQPGTYISSVSESLRYHLREHPEIQGADFSSYAQEPDLARVAVEDQLFGSAILRTASTGSAELDDVQEVLLQALRNSPNYELTATMPAREYTETDMWLVFTKVETQ